MQDQTTSTFCHHQPPVIFRDPVVDRELCRLLENFVLAPTESASTYYTIVCKEHYVDILIEELGLYSLTGNPTCNHTYFYCTTINRFSIPMKYRQILRARFALHLLNFEDAQKIPINTDSLRVHPTVQTSPYPFYSPNSLHILSKALVSLPKNVNPKTLKHKQEL